jgi:UDP-N-acetylmuramoylalanine--D-glutamate ligase
LILGGRDKDSDFNRLRPLVRRNVRRVLLIGEAAGRIAASLRGAVPMVRCGNMERAVDTALADARPGDVLLLAPACTSFDQYSDFEERGRHFKQIVTSRSAGGP